MKRAYAKNKRFEPTKKPRPQHIVNPNRMNEKDLFILNEARKLAGLKPLCKDGEKPPDGKVLDKPFSSYKSYQRKYYLRNKEKLLQAQRDRRKMLSLDRKRKLAKLDT